jgi:hypothetical protein
VLGLSVLIILRSGPGTVVARKSTLSAGFLSIKPVPGKASALLTISPEAVAVPSIINI